MNRCQYLFVILNNLGVGHPHSLEEAIKMTVLVYLKKSLAAENSNVAAYPVAEIEISELLKRISEKFGIERAKRFNTKDLMTYAASMVMRRPEEIILRSKPICKGA